MRSHRVPAAVTRRDTMRGAVVLGLAAGAITGLAAVGYVAAYPDPADRLQVAAGIGANPGLAALFGEPRALETVAGFTEWRILGVLPFITAVWVILAVTRALRGAEDAGRWDVLLAGPVGRQEATAWGLLGIGASIVAFAAAGLATGAALGASSLGISGVVWMSAVLLMVAAVFGAVAAVASQVSDTRSGALRWSAAALGLAYLIRVVGITSDASWLAWLTPLGWADLAAPLTDPTAAPLLVGAGAAIGLLAAAVALSGRRDVGAGLFGQRGSRRSWTADLTSTTGLAARLAAPTAAAWALGLALLGGVLGLVAPTAGESLADADLSEAPLQFGGADADGAALFLGAAFLVVTLLLGVMSAGQAAAARDEEASGRLDTALASPATRQGWLAGRIAVAVVMLVAGGLAAGLGAWLGTAAAGERQDLADVVSGGLNAVPGAFVVLGVGVLAFGLLPRSTAALAYGYLAAAFVLEIIGSALDLPEMVLALSVFHHVPLVPAVPAEPLTSGLLIACGLAGAAGGALGLSRRDIATG
jgi:ABC-2 type transport system permease protein